MRDKVTGGLIYLVLLFLPVLMGCPAPDVEAAPSPGDNFPMELAAQQADTFTVVATWPPVVFHGDTIRTYEWGAEADDGSWGAGGRISAIGSHTFDVPSPSPGETKGYTYCLRSVTSTGTTSTDSACAAWQYTNPDTIPPPPDSVSVDPQQTVAADSLVLYPDSLVVRCDSMPPTNDGCVTLAYDRGVRVDSVPGRTYQLQATLWRGGSVVGCFGACADVLVQPTEWENDVPVAFMARPGTPTYFGEQPDQSRLEWMAVRLPWFRQLTFGRS